MQRFSNVLILGLLLITGWACSSVPEKSWIKAVPQRTPALIVPAKGATFNNVLNSEYAPVLDDISASAIHLISDIDSSSTAQLQLKAILVYPSTSNQWQPVWISKAPSGYVNQLEKKFKRRFTQNSYIFHDQKVIKMDIQDRILYATQLKQWLLISENSLGIEDAIRSYLDLDPSINLQAEQVVPSRLILNTPHLDQWIEQLAQVKYRPVIKNAFKGTEPTVLSLQQGDEKSNLKLHFNGTIPLNKDKKTNLISSISSENDDISLDRYISSNAASFAILRQPALSQVPDSVHDATPLDSLLLNDTELFRNITGALDPEFSVVMFAESGFLSVGENLFIRHLSDAGQLNRQLNELGNRDYIKHRDRSYLVKSKLLARIIGSDLCGYDEFYISTTGQAAIISKRRGLTEGVQADRSRRRVVYYDNNYRIMRKSFPDQPSGIVVTNSQPFLNFVKPYLSPDNYVSALTSKFDYLTMTFALNNSNDQLKFNLSTYSKQKSTQPYREKWIYPLSGTELSGKPVMADIGGSSRDEVIFATKSGQIHALASDGTDVLSMNTQTDTPIGSPVVYDWYGNGTQVILQAAGRKIYAWNTTGELLPKFPMRVDEQITAPLVVADVSRDGIPELLVATANRELHALDGRGKDISGWPQKTNAIIQSKPVLENVDREWSVWVFAENGLHAWDTNGMRRDGYPKFINASYTGHPVFYKDHILGGAKDGHLYAMGQSPLFADSLNVYETQGSMSDDSYSTQAIYISNTAINGSPSVHHLTIQHDEIQETDDYILTMSSNGSVFLLKTDGNLVFTQSMGQPADPEFSPEVAKLHTNGGNDILGLANFGRLYAWNASSGDRVFGIPTAGMKYPVVVDLDRNGQKELIAQTDEGVRCWTLNSVD